MKDFTEMSDLELLLSVGSSRPCNDGLAKLAGMYSSHGYAKGFIQDRINNFLWGAHRQEMGETGVLRKDSERKKASGMEDPKNRARCGAVPLAR